MKYLKYLYYIAVYLRQIAINLEALAILKSDLYYQAIAIADNDVMKPPKEIEE